MTNQADDVQNEAERILQEYQDFVHIMSHDLSAPLRHVKEFTRLLIGARADSLSEKEKLYAEMLEKALLRLELMQTSLLTFSRVNTDVQPFESVDGQVLVQNALRALEIEIEALDAQIEVEAMPSVQGDALQLGVVFYNVLHNALRFQVEGAQRVIGVEAVEDDGFHVFRITDNGIGIDAAFHGEIFKMFRRLHGPDSYPGAGCGLSIAQKIIERHGGQIWVDSTVNEGISVCFSLPISV